MSGKKAQELARVAARQCISRAYETRVSIIADAIQDGMRLCKDVADHEELEYSKSATEHERSCEDTEGYSQIADIHGALACRLISQRIAALMEEQ